MKRFLLLTAVLSALFASGCGLMVNRSQQAEIHYILGVSYLREGNQTLALKEFLAAADYDSRNPEIQDALGQAYHLKKAYSDAEQHYLRAVRLSKGNPQFQNNLAALYLDTRRWDEAIHYFRLAAGNLLFLSPEVAWAGMANAYFNKGDYLEAVRTNQEALRIDPRYLRARLQLGDAYFALDRTDLAIEEYRQVAQAAPGLAIGHFKLGQSYMKAKEPKKAAAAFLEVVRLASEPDLVRQAGDYLKILQ